VIGLDALDREAAVKALDWIRSHCAKDDDEMLALVRSKLGRFFGVRTASGVAMRAVSDTGTRKKHQ
jgi:hypothetical protein